MRKMTQTPVPKLVTTLAIPTIISMMVSAIYNMADTFSFHQLGTSAVGAVGIVFSPMAIIQAIGFYNRHGLRDYRVAAPWGKRGGKGHMRRQYGLFSAIVLGLALTVLGRFCRTLMQVLGATGNDSSNARDYGQYILLAAPDVCALPL